MLLTNRPTTDYPVKVAVIGSGIDPTYKRIGAVHEVPLDAEPPRCAPSASAYTPPVGIVQMKGIVAARQPPSFCNSPQPLTTAEVISTTVESTAPPRTHARVR